MTTVCINGISQSFDEGTLIVDAAKALGFDIPTFCSHPRLDPVAVCRMCLVEVEGQPKLLPACATPVSDGMVVHTESDTVKNTQESTLEILLANHPLDCPVCDKGGECQLQDQAYSYGAAESHFDENKRRFHEADMPLNKVVVSNLNRCIQCQLCVRYCDEVVGAQALGAIGIGADTTVSGFMESLENCDQCGNCIEVCPVGALMSLPYRYKSRPWDLKEVDTICPFCATGCQVTVGARDRELMRVRSKSESGLNREALCVRGRFGLDFTTQTEHRIQQPMIRHNGNLVSVSWDEAFDFIHEKVTHINKNKQSIGGLISPSMTNETLYGFQKLMQQVFGSQLIDSFCRWPLGQAYPVLGRLIDDFYSRKPLEDILGVDHCIILGCNITDENPVSEYMVREAHHKNNLSLSLLTTRPTRLDRIAEHVQRYLPGEEVELIKPIFDKTDSQKLCVLLGTDIFRSPRVNQTLLTLESVLFSLQTGGKHVDLQFLLDRPNQLGAWDLGIKNGIDFETMLKQSSSGDMGMLYVVGEDPLLSCPDGYSVAESLQKLSLLVVQDSFMSETAKVADVVLPGFTFAESAGTFTNNEGRVQRVRPIYPPPTKTVMNVNRADIIYSTPGPSKAKRDTDIFNELSLSFDKNLGLSSLEVVFSEIAKRVPEYQDIDVSAIDEAGAFSKNKTSARLALSGLPDGPDPSPNESKTSSSLNQCNDQTNTTEGANIYAATATATNRGIFKLITGNCMFHSGYLSEYSPTLTSIADKAYVEVNEQDAITLNLKDKDLVTVSRASHVANLQLKTNKHFPPGVAFIPENFKSVQVNRFIHSTEDSSIIKIEPALSQKIEISLITQAATGAKKNQGKFMGGRG